MLAAPCVATVTDGVDEQSLEAAVRRGDPAAFEALVRAQSDAVFRIVAGLVGRDDAEDVAQEVFVAVHQSLPRFRGRSKLSTWVYRIATNVALKRLRSRHRRSKREQLLADHDPAGEGDQPSAGIEADEQRAALQRALDALPEHQRAVVVLRGQEGLPYEEVARVLGIRRATAESRMARAKVRLRELLKDWVEDA